MRIHKLNLAGAVATVAAVVALGAGTAWAAATWTVANGGAGLPFTQVGTSTMKDTSTGDTLSCTGGSGTINIPNGAGLNGNGIGSIATIGFTGCTGPLSISFTVTPGSTLWTLNAFSYDNSTGITDGTITNVDAKLAGVLCTAEITGTVDASYKNSTGTLVVSPNGNLLTVKSATCLGVLKAGDVVQFNGTYRLNNTPYVQITSP